MYVVADCGQEMHVPLFDVESGCISICDQDGTPIEIRVTNGLGFDETGTEVCWRADFHAVAETLLQSFDALTRLSELDPQKGH